MLQDFSRMVLNGLVNYLGVFKDQSNELV